MAFLYRHIRLDKNEPFYIGIGSSKARCYTKRTRNKHWHSVTKHTDYRVDIIFDDITIEEAKEKEKEFIALYGKKSNGGILVNVTDGGDGCFGRKATLEETKIRSKRMIENNHFKGKKHSEATREKMRLAKLGKSKPQISIDKHKIAMKKYVADLHWNSKIILDTAFGVYYSSVKEAAQYANMNISTFIRAMKKGTINYIRV